MLNPNQVITDMPAISVHNLRKRFGKNVALDGVHFVLRQGERLGLLGPNGAGKTTLVRCLARRIRADEGTIEVLGEPITHRGGSARLGIVPQELAIYEDLTAHQNLLFFGRFHGLKGRLLRERVEWALEWTGLADRAQQLIRGFSGGMKRRINLACGVMHSPKILLLDEPTVGVDPQSRERIYTMVDSLSEGGCSILLTTHHLEEAEGQCERLVIMDRGGVIADGTIDELIDQSVGPLRWVRLRLANPSGQKKHHQWDTDFSDLQAHTVSIAGDEQVVSARMDNVAKNLPRLLHQMREQGAIIKDVEVQSPSLHDVFLDLTGEQLRDV